MAEHSAGRARAHGTRAAATTLRLPMPFPRRTPTLPQAAADRAAEPTATVFEAGVDRTLAAAGYALIGASLFTVWITGLLAWLIAWTHRKSPDPVARAHFRYQMLVADLAGLAVGVGAALVISGAWFVVGPVFDGDTPTGGELGGGLAHSRGAAACCSLAAFVGTLVGVGFGAVRLVRGRPRGPTTPPLSAAPRAPPEHHVMSKAPLAPYPATRLRRLRQAPWIRDLVRETVLTPADLIWTLVVHEGEGEVPVASMPGAPRLSVQGAADAARTARALGIPAIAVFPHVDGSQQGRARQRRPGPGRRGRPRRAAP